MPYGRSPIRYVSSRPRHLAQANTGSRVPPSRARHRASCTCLTSRSLPHRSQRGTTTARHLATKTGSIVGRRPYQGRALTAHPRTAAGSRCVRWHGRPRVGVAPRPPSDRSGACKSGSCAAHRTPGACQRVPLHARLDRSRAAQASTDARMPYTRGTASTRLRPGRAAAAPSRAPRRGTRTTNTGRSRGHLGVIGERDKERRPRGVSFDRLYQLR
jgi:hypothetical protein